MYFLLGIHNQISYKTDIILVKNHGNLVHYSINNANSNPLTLKPGLQFMVKYSTTQPYAKCAYLCLLCERNLTEMRAIAHVLSSTHVFNYLVSILNLQTYFSV